MPRATKQTLKGLHTAIKSTTLPTAAATTISAVLQNQDTSILKAFVSLYCLVDLSTFLSRPFAAHTVSTCLCQSCLITYFAGQTHWFTSASLVAAESIAHGAPTPSV